MRFGERYMKNIFVGICILFIPYVNGYDVIDSLLSKAVVAKGLFSDNRASEKSHDQKFYNQPNVENQKKKKYSKANNYRKKNIAHSEKKIETNPLKFKRNKPVLKRDIIFPQERIKSISISPNGQKIAYIYENNNGKFIRIISTTNENMGIKEVAENYSVNNFVFIGNSLLYTYYDENNCLRITLLKDLIQKKQLDFPDNIVSVRLFKNNNSCLAECFDGERYHLYKISVDSESCTYIKELSEPIMSIFDKSLSPALIIKNENGIQKIFVEEKAKKIHKFEDNVDFVNETLNQIDQINDPNSEKYFSVDRDNNFYKMSIVKPQNYLLLEVINHEKGIRQEIYKLNGISSFDQIKINLEVNGRPSFVTMNNRRYFHYSWDPKMKNHINIINKKVGVAGSWYRINTTADGNIWLLCITNDKARDKFYLYDVRTHNMLIVPKLVREFKNQYLQSTECCFIPLNNKEYLQMFFTRGVNSNINTPMVILTNSSRQYKWEYMPIVQLLANRGYNVLCLNYRKDQISYDVVDDYENVVSKATSDIAKAVNWCIENNRVRHGNIILLSKKHSAVPAMRMFLKYPKSFAGYISLNPDEEDLLQICKFDLNKISRPMLFIGRFNNSEVMQKFAEKISSKKCSIISSNIPMSQKLSTGIIETFLAKKFDNPNVEKLSQQDMNSVDLILDNLGLIRVSDDSHIYDEGGNNIGDTYDNI